MNIRLTRQRLIPFLKTSWGLLLVAQLLAITPLRGFSLLLILLVAARMIPFGRGLFTKLALAFGLITTAITCIAVTGWFWRLSFTSSGLLTILIFGLVGLLFLFRWRGIVSHYRLQLDWHDSFAAIIGALAALLVLWPVLQLNEAARLAQVVTAGGDNTSHLTLFKVNDLNHGIAYGDGNRVNHIQKNASYPQGWHFNLAFLKWLTEPQITYHNAPRNLLLLFYSYSVAWFGLLFFLIARLALTLVSRGHSARPSWALVGVLLVCAAVGLHWLVGLLARGFEAQIAAVALLLLMILLLIEAGNREPSKRYPALLLATIMAVGINFIWPFITPISLVLLAAACGITLFQTKRLPPVYVLVALPLLALYGVVQPLMYKLYPVYFGLPTALQRGDAQHTSMYTLLALFVITTAFAVMHWKNKAVRILWGSTAITLLYCLALFKYHLNELGELRYFYFKATYVFIILATILLAALAYELLRLLLQQRAQVKQWLQKTCVVVAAIIVGCMVCWQIQSPEIEKYTNSTLSGIEVGQAWPLINAISPSPENGYYTAFMGSCNRGDDIRATQLAEALAFVDPKTLPRGHAAFDPGAHEETLVFLAITEATKLTNGSITVISGDQVLSNKLLAYAGAHAANINIVNYDTTPETEPITQCLDRHRDLTAFPLR